MRQVQKPWKRGTQYSFFSVLFLVLFGVISGAQASNPVLSGPEAAVNTACTTEATTASCGSETAGHGLVKCIHAYKKANPSFQISATCHAAIKTFISDARAQRASKAITPSSSSGTPTTQP
jgi:hypothetical protein